MSRYTGMLSALVLTALLFWLLPGLVSGQLREDGRIDHSLRPARARTMVVWVTSWQPEDRSLLSGLCSAFEKQRPGLRIYLRRVDAEELYLKEAVLPDVVLHAPGEILAPDQVLLPLTAPAGYPENAVWSGMYRGSLYALPLWYSPNLLCLPESWQQAPQGAPQEAKEGRAYFALETPVPQVTAPPLTAESLPWARLTEKGAVWADSPIALTQLMHLCPTALRQELARCTPQTGPAPEDAALLRSLVSHLSAEDGRIPLVLPAVTSLRVRYASLCRHSEDAAAFIAFLAEAAEAAAEKQLVHAGGGLPARGDLLGQTLALAGSGQLLPNAFVMSREAMERLCLEGFTAGEDPVATLLRLR